MADWKYKLNIKQHLATNEGPDFDYDDHCIRIAVPGVLGEVKMLMKRVENVDSELYVELDEVADWLEDIVKEPGAFDDVVAEFNQALARLYDIGDEGHRIWVR